MTDSNRGAVTDGTDGLAVGFFRFVTRRWRRVALDLLLITGWVIVLARAIQQLGWPSWTYYLVLVASIVAYSLFFDPWHNPDGDE